MRALRAFVRAVELGSFTAAASELEVGQPTVSRWISGLEKRLGTTLISRTTRSHSLTEAGRVYFDYCRRILDTVDAAESHVRSLQGSPSGSLRVTIPMSFGRLWVVPAIPRFLERHPRIDLDLEMSDRWTDLIREGFDLAIRIGNLPDSTLMSTRLGATRRVVVGAPAYFDTHGRPQTPDDLREHECLLYTGVAEPHSWSFGHDGESQTVRVQGGFSANNGEAVREVALAAGGVAMLPTWLVGADLRRGALEEVLAPYASPGLDMRAVYPAAERVPPKTEAFVAFLREALRTEGVTTDPVGG